MIVALLRHGVAEDAGPATGFRDELRALTEEGRERMAAAAHGVRMLDLPIDIVLTSPLVRCVQTAQIVADANGWPVRADARLRPGFDAGRLLDLLLEHPQAEGVMICGHQPDMSFVAADLIAGGTLEFKKGALAVVELETPRLRAGTLLAHYPPRALRRMG